MSEDPRATTSDWARRLFASLADAGVTDVVLSPGSRSTPFVLAAHAEPRLRCHDVIDERSAAFFAVGLAKVTGVPPVLLCTSGTAAAHYFPAVIEASRSGTPLLAVTADRPFELQHCDANQTIDQVKLFGDHARLFVDLGIPDATPGALRWLERMAARATLAARWPLPGPVQINARARKPLEPPESTSSSGPPTSTPFRTHLPRSTPSPEALDAVADACVSARRGLIVCGPGPVANTSARAELESFAKLTGFPVLAEATSQFRFCALDTLRCDAFELLLRSSHFRAAHAPDVILQLGAPPTSSAWETFLAANPDAQRLVLSTGAWADPQSSASALVLGDLAETLRGAAERLRTRRPSPEPTAWAQSWRAANEAAWSAVDRTTATFGEAAAVRAVVSALPKGSLLAVGNSLPVREVDAFCRAPSADCLVLSQRGASGIDGLISGAAGAASTGRPTTLLLGDVSFLHDVGGLAAARTVRAPFAIVVLNNGGGRIFEQLPVAQSPAATGAMHHWLTPHHLLLHRAAALFDLPGVRVSDAEALARELALAHGREGCTVIEVVVPPSSSADAFRAIDAQLEALP